MSRRKLRDCGYLPKRSLLKAGMADDYKGVPVADIESGKFFDSRWYYDNPLTPKSVRGEASGDIYNPELRKSYLPVPLFLSVDFWINLPMVTDMEGLGVCAALGNASIWNMSNNERFLKSPANASMAARRSLLHSGAQRQQPVYDSHARKGPVRGGRDIQLTLYV